MAVPSSKADLVAAIGTTFAQLESDLDRVPPSLVYDQVLPGHAKNTMMSPAELVSYLIGWNEQVATWHARRAAGLPDELPAAGIKWNELGLLAQRYYDAYRDETWDELRAHLVGAKDNLLALIEDYTDADLYGRQWYGKWTMGRMISLNSSSPYMNARGRLRAWLRAAPLTPPN
ncbi:hypothetical protein C3B61_13090 [Cryobacterium zongtaii]|uniref:ClbS/DfsB family four-helix bundle protein n=1 Tax=Cryobacterium zongtaii TaxID=1259217 RepID=A0A2S3ZDD4_9MICO|nr:ClbS/DfsB family four-helix bundle protein [Cryobacterium zongtaii]POH64379.1 hypothetical protein C3B61_13090 [Cryobacterium zongtaii]